MSECPLLKIQKLWIENVELVPFFIAKVKVVSTRIAEVFCSTVRIAKVKFLLTKSLN